MRLIDADAFFNDFPELRVYEYASYDYGVDAVPVSFLEKLRENAQNKEAVLTIYEIITLWRIKECD